MFLSKMKCDELTNFEFLTRLFRLDDPFNPKWKLTFLATLPNWFAKKFTKVFLDDVTKYAWGFRRKGVIGENVFTCNQINMARAASDSSKGHSYNKLCKQYHIATSSTSKPRKKKHHESSSPPASNFQGGRRRASRKRIVHKIKPQFKRTKTFIACCALAQRPLKKTYFIKQNPILF